MAAKKRISSRAPSKKAKKPYCRVLKVERLFTDDLESPPIVDTEPEAEPRNANDRQVGGEHYKGRQIEPWDYNIANGLPFMEGTIVKYITRWQQCGGLQDLRKVQHYVEKMIEVEKERLGSERITPQ